MKANRFIRDGLLLPLVFIPAAVHAQAITSTIRGAIDNMVTLLSLILVGAMAWAGFQMYRGTPDATTKLIYTIVGLIVVNSAEALVKFFT